MQKRGLRLIDRVIDCCLVGHGYTVIYPTQRGSDRGQECNRILSRPDHNMESAVEDLPEREILSRSWGHIQGTLVNVFDFTDDLPYRRASAFGIRESLTNRVLVGKVFTGKRSIDDRHARHRSVICLGEESSAHELSAHRGQVSGTDVAFVNFVFAGEFGFPNHLDRVGAAIALNRQKAGESYRLNARQLPNTARDLLIEFGSLSVGTGCAGKNNLRGGQM